MVDDDDVAEDGAAFLVMELLQGETVHARFERKGGRLPVGRGAVASPTSSSTCSPPRTPRASSTAT